ncbi:hypothetical protein [Pusillimonas noertemannii]|uniref:Uncharacterized protein n=1 Tax=Pusillimonas noertemannii TaxID=305977 RepID=A0A2U1CRU3_9BURK|nr:hypothetical protein [Pusillimonas noertemannii]NYT67948.1 hypothetical protein [Pusillimonas noertemannii]PVY68620.1 hypothetical protein C7440_1031 [Pusillimonas noertemannii]TFL11911.1 hypothetical protein CSC72_01915 [Pusillimonas noertemannii]
MREPFDFSGLRAKQEWLILYMGWRPGQKYPDGSPWPQPSKPTVRKLIERGLMEAVEVKQNSGRFLLTVTEYRVPLHVHAAFCLTCGPDEDGATHA